MTQHEKIGLMCTYWTLKFHHNFMPKHSLTMKLLETIQHTMGNSLQVVEQSVCLNLLQNGDEIMADYGFTIEDLLVP